MPAFLRILRENMYHPLPRCNQPVHSTIFLIAAGSLDTCQSSHCTFLFTAGCRKIFTALPIDSYPGTGQVEAERSGSWGIMMTTHSLPKYRSPVMPYRCSPNSQPVPRPIMAPNRRRSHILPLGSERPASVCVVPAPAGSSNPKTPELVLKYLFSVQSFPFPPTLDDTKTACYAPPSMSKTPCL
jgi:hypothetical protein